MNILNLNSMGDNHEKSCLLPSDECIVYTRRWYILAVFSLLALYQCCIWNTWGPVVDVLTVVYPDWTQATVSLLANWCSIAFLIFMLPVLYLQNNNLRYSILLTSSFIAVGKNALRLILTAKMCFKLIFIQFCDATKLILDDNINIQELL